MITVAVLKKVPKSGPKTGPRKIATEAEIAILSTFFEITGHLDPPLALVFPKMSHVLSAVIKLPYFGDTHTHQRIIKLKVKVISAPRPLQSWISLNWDFSNMRRSLVLIFGQNVRFMSTSKPPNMKVKLHLSSKIEMIFCFAQNCFYEIKILVLVGNELAL